MKQYGKEKRTVHEMQCPENLGWFDMRDLEAVLAHQHWMEQKPQRIGCSHTRQIGDDNEIFYKKDGRMVTRRYSNGEQPFPDHRA